MLRYTLPILGLLIFFSSGCGTKSGPTPRSVKGQVKLDGKPMPEGEIMFSIPGIPPLTMEIKNGSYSGSAHEGKARVEIRAYKAAAPVMMGGQVVNQGSKENYLPDRFNTNSTFTAEVTSAGANEFNFEVTSK